jgi:agmatine/peptidylarginine deiminase
MRLISPAIKMICKSLKHALSLKTILLTGNIGIRFKETDHIVDDIVKFLNAKYIMENRENIDDLAKFLLSKNVMETRSQEEVAKLVKDIKEKNLI